MKLSVLLKINIKQIWADNYFIYTLISSNEIFGHDQGRIYLVYVTIMHAVTNIENQQHAGIAKRPTGHTGHLSIAYFIETRC